MLSDIFNIFGKEFKSYFRTPIGYIIIGVYLVISMFATFYSSYFFINNNSGLISFFTYQPEILVSIIPAVTMKLWSEERRSGTIEFLLTQPISYTAIVLGKFSAAGIFGIMLLLLTIPFTLYIHFLTEIDLLNVLSGYVGTILSILLLTSIGCLVSAFNTNAILAYLFTVFLGWLLTTINYDFIIAPLFELTESISYRLSQSLNFYPNYQDIIQGELGIDNITYFLSLTVLILWINRCVIEYRKQ